MIFMHPQVSCKPSTFSTQSRDKDLKNTRIKKRIEGEEIMEAYRRCSLVNDRYGNQRGLCLAIKNTFISAWKNLRCSLAIQAHRIANYRRN